ncbi:MAG TPA: transcription elongation factor subunit Spt4 [Candidatus Nanoarchaeia archaeon]|nr:transcription elongation factor subunit Spt4 [Candidatus Nanoarchaeia archaeon]
MKRVCKQDRIFVEEGNCPICHNTDFATAWQGRISVIDTGKSFIGRKAGIKREGDYALRIR